MAASGAENLIEDELPEYTDSVSRASIYILPRKIQKKRLQLLKSLCKRLPISETYSPCVSHIVSDCGTVEEVFEALDHADADLWCQDVHIVNTQWLSLCVKQDKILPVTDDHRLPYAQVEQTDETSGTPASSSSIPFYACQRDTPLEGKNKRITDAFIILEKNADFIGGNNNYSRALAFRNCYAMLKSLPTEITTLRQLRGLPHLGNHCLKVIKDIIENGYSEEAQSLTNNDWFTKMELFTGVFGVGVGTAKKWIGRGISSIEQAMEDREQLRNDERLYLGLAFYEDLSSPVPRTEAVYLEQLVQEEVQRIVPGTTVLLTGGFIRGKSTGHDIDLLISHPEEGKERGLLPNLLDRLASRGLMLYGKWQQNSFTDDVLHGDAVAGEYLKSHLDHFEKWIGIMKIPQNLEEPQIAAQTESTAAANQVTPCRQWTLEEAQTEAGLARDWTARRVDLIVVPASQYYYAKVGWIGSKLFNRSLRTYAKREMSMTLTSHGLYGNRRSIPANSEQDVFDNLNLQYRDPTLRNC